MDGCWVDGCLLDGCLMDGWMDAGWMDDGWMDDGWGDGWMGDGWMDKSMCALCACLGICVIFSCTVSTPMWIHLPSWMYAACLSSLALLW